MDGERVEAGLSNARSRSWHNYPGNAVPWEAETPDFSPRQGCPRLHLKTIILQNSCHFSIPSSSPSPAPLPALSDGSFAVFLFVLEVQSFMLLQPHLQKVGISCYSMLLPSSGAVTRVHTIRPRPVHTDKPPTMHCADEGEGRHIPKHTVDADYSKHQRQIPNTNLRDQVATFLWVISMTINSHVLLVRRMNAGSTGLRVKVRCNKKLPAATLPRSSSIQRINPQKCRLFFKTM